MRRFDDARVLVTGGTSGMGWAAARRFLDEGATVAITGRDGDRLEEATARLAEAADGGDGAARDRVLPLVCDAADVDAVEAAMMTVRDRFGRLDVVFANAGAGHFARIEDISAADVDTVVGIDLKGVFFTVQKALPLMPDGAAIVLNASWTLHRGLTASTLYSATKAAVHNLARTMACELAPRRIRVNSVSPGYINTGQFNEDRLGADEARRRRGFVPLGRFGDPEEIAGAVAFLASGDASYVNAQDLIVDGGLVGTQP